jgi:glycosyltransferase involved in cell wall biosynthesis
VCESIAQEIVQRYGVRKPLIVHNCPPRAASPAHTPVNRLREKAGLLDHPEPLVLYQGGFAPHRGLETLIEAACDFHRGVLVLMGWGRIEDDLQSLIVRLGLEQRAMIVGPAEQHELLQFTRGADLGVIPYQPVGLNNYYTTPNKLFEYMASGIAVAGSRLPELQRFVEGHDFGVTFDPTDSGDIARAVNLALEDDDRLATMKFNALVASKAFVWENEAVKLVEAYDQLPA